jgi:hypothetical protein
MGENVLLQWLTFAVMILIQAVAAGVIISAIRTTLSAHSEEIKSLREWRHAFGPKEMVYDDHGVQLKDHETRLRTVETRHLSRVEVEACPVSDCPVRKQYLTDQE